MAGPSPVQLSLTTALPAYRPGEIVTALLHASTSLPEDVELLEVEVQFVGVERVDTSWVAPAYRKDVPALNADRRRVQRHVLASKLQAATQGAFADANLRRFLIRFTLPSWLPPTFKGTAVRYSYYLEAKLSYFQYTDGGAGGDEAAERPGQAGSLSTRLPVQVWPSAEQSGAATASSTPATSSVASSPRGAGGEGPAAAAAAARAGDAFPAVGPEEFPVKCWEIGHGTAVEDAISHIAKLNHVGAAAPGTPFSPGLMARARARTGSEVPSEISSHDEGGIRPPAADRPAPAARGDAAGDAAAAAGTGLRSFALRIGDAPLARVCVHPPLAGPLQPGATLAGTLEFPTDGPLRCMQVAVSLETEEAVEAAWRGKGAAGGGGGLRRVLEEQSEVTADAACTNFLFSLPRDATPTFQTPLVSLKWLLRFAFTALRDGGAAEQLAWALPLAVVPPQPQA